MSNNKKVLIYILVFLICFVIGIVTVMIINRVRTYEQTVDLRAPTLQEEREAFLELPRDDRAAVLMETVWGENFWDIIAGERVINSPWANISVERTQAHTLNELEIITYIILQHEPYLGSTKDSVLVPIADNLYVDLKAELHTFSDFSFRYPKSGGENTVNVTCRRDGVLMNYAYSFGN